MNCLYCNQPCETYDLMNSFTCLKCEGSPRFSDWNGSKTYNKYYVDYVTNLDDIMLHIFFYPAKQEAAIYFCNNTEKVPFRFIVLAHPCLTPNNLHQFVSRIAKLKAFI